MNIGLILTDASLIAPLLFLGFVIFTFLKGGVHVKGQGWKTKEEAPKTYFFIVVFMGLIGILGFVFRVLR